MNEHDDKTREALERIDAVPSAGDGSATGFFRAAVTRPVTLFVALTTLIVIGVIAYTRIPIQMLPDGWTEPELGHLGCRTRVRPRRRTRTRSRA